MAATNFTPISLYYTTTAAAAPVAGNLVSGELAINITDGKLYYKNNAGVVTLLASTSGASGDVVGPASATDNALARFDLTTGKLIQNSVGILSDAGILTGLTGLTSSGSITFSSLTSGRVTYASASGLLTDSANFTYGTGLSVNGISQVYQTGLYTTDGTLSNYSVNNGVYLNGNATGWSQLSGDGTRSSFVRVWGSGASPADFIVFNTASSERMRISSTGNVGIGTSSPSYVLDVAGIGRLTTAVNSNATSLILNNSNTAAGGVGVSIDGYSGNTSNKLAQIVFGGAGATGGNVDFLTSANGSSYVQQMRLDTSGNLGLGVTPSAWTATHKAYQLQGGGSLYNNGADGYLNVANNFYYDGTNWRRVTAAPVSSYLQSSSGHLWGYTATGAADSICGFPASQMTLDASGNLGVGTTSPATKLNIENAGACQLQMAYGSTIFGRVGRLSSGNYEFSSYENGGSLLFGTTTTNGSTTERARIDSSGNVGIGTTSQNERLRLNSSSAGQARMSISYQDSTISFYGSYSGIVGAGNATDTFLSSANVLAFGSGGTSEKMRLDSSGNVGIGTNSPSSYVNGLTVAKSTTSGGDIALVKTDSGTTDQGGQSLRFFNYAPAGYGRVSGTKIGSIYFLASQPSSGGIQDAAAIECLAETQTGNSTSSQLAFYTATGATLVKAMTIDSQQNVGISTTNAAAFTIFPSKLVVGSGTGNQQITVYSGTTSEGNIIFADGTSGTQQYMGLLRYDHADNGMKFYTNGGTFGGMFNSIGDFLVGTTSNTTNGGFIFSPTYNGTGVSAAIFGHSSAGGNGNQYMIFNYNGTGIGSITQNGTTGVLYNITSDQRLKTNVVDAPSGNIDDIKVRSFDWIADGSHQEYGMVAQELIEVAPYAVNKPENPDEMMGVDYSKLVPMMIKEIQDLKAEVNQLKAKIGV